jgi:hypothetical protein
MVTKWFKKNFYPFIGGGQIISEQYEMTPLQNQHNYSKFNSSKFNSFWEVNSKFKSL